MSERENLGAGIYAALSAFLLLICFLGAFLLPPALTGGKWLGIFALVGYFAGVPLLLRLAHRSRIRDAVAKSGGRVLCIKQLPFWRQRYSRHIFFLGTRYRVDYVDLFGATHRALCNSGFFQGVQWLDDAVIAGQ